MQNTTRFSLSHKTLKSHWSKNFDSGLKTMGRFNVNLIGGGTKHMQVPVITKLLRSHSYNSQQGCKTQQALV